MIKLVLILGLALLSGIAHAAQTSIKHLATFAQDGKTFVLIEKGIQDGSGAAYANAYAIDVATDTWISGFPVRIRQDEAEVFASEGQPPDNPARREFSKLQNIVEKLLSNSAVKGRVDQPAPTSHRVSNAPWDLNADTKQARFSILDIFPSSREIWQLKLENLPFPADEQCYGFKENMAGYRLSLINDASGKSILLNEDKRVPKSRNCPTDYAIADVLTHTGANGKVAMAVVLRVTGLGYEGPDRHLMALTTTLP